MVANQNCSPTLSVLNSFCLDLHILSGSGLLFTILLSGHNHYISNSTS